MKTMKKVTSILLSLLLVAGLCTAFPIGARAAEATISVSALDPFGNLQAPYAQPEAQTVTVTNTGTEPVTLTQPMAFYYDIGALSITDLDPDEDATFTVCPKAGLPPGNYDETIEISGTDGPSRPSK